MTDTTSLSRAVPRTCFVVLMIMVAGLLTACHSQSPARGAHDPRTAATLFVGSINNGRGDGAAAISCSSFADGARSAARSGQDPGITFSLGSVTTDGDTATAIVTQAIDVGGSTQKSQRTLTLRKTDGLWLVCGQS